MSLSRIYSRSICSEVCGSVGHENISNILHLIVNMVLTYLQYDVLHSSILDLGGPSKFLALGVVVNQVHFTIHLLRHTTLSSFYIICLTITPLTCTSCRSRASYFPVVSPISGNVEIGFALVGQPTVEVSQSFVATCILCLEDQPWHCWTTFHQVDLQLILSP